MAHNLNCKGIEVWCSLAPPVSLVPHSFSLLNSRHSSVMLSSHNSSRAGVPLGCQESVPYDRGSSYAVRTEKHCTVRPEARDWQMLRTQSGRNPSPLPYHETITKKICLNSEWKKINSYLHRLQPATLMRDASITRASPMSPVLISTRIRRHQIKPQESSLRIL